MKNIQNLNIKEIANLPSPDSYINNIPATDSQSLLVKNSRNTIKEIINGKDKRLLLLVGPCSIHDSKAGIEYAKKLKKLSEKVKENIYY